ncbi:MAG: bifunctional phosphopantothenoylcysteine decarboxylase/phosphopantothenate--cysteine ligase CoaBC [Paraprevotella sp.]|nr:bifunctional phosphopantothenoylcysteine decarboxylase/phosphopantothenate--cysteine ligase CoaBC [Paraprevotella sp.]MDD6821945.1 bifunctional phosphopantothenoylcysteine decarboxylase/phosphopantothenate--cysteine ligase CoaBC [Paraprevotella sp.]MDY3099110.1 bifunctional phosphopantothenoylcysteine decarboxylase/phosphopantothenate--cysteine ligase CoaBC [Bacteroidaceae bacterium]
MLRNKHIVLGITGSIAAYKACLIIRGLIKQGAEVQVVITPAGREFITPITLSTLTQKPVICDFFNHQDGTWNSHVDLGLWADAMLIAPATASTIGKMAHGVADNMLITTYLSMKAPVFIAPAMDLDMYAHPSTQENLQLLSKRGNHIIEPGTGFLASKLEGKGRMQEPEEIVRTLDEYFSQSQELKGKRVLITAGPTYEKIDPVRFIGNYSSGKMGFALAEECARRGAEVELVSGPVSLQIHHPSVHRTNVESAQEMFHAATERFTQADIAILCAAVADFTPTQVAGTKIKREGEELVLHLSPTHDIAQCLGKMKRDGQIMIGFALETNDEEAHAKDKLKRKNLDFIVMNSLQDKGAGFRHDTNKVTIIDAQGKTEYPLKDKKEVAEDIVNRICTLLS